MLTGYSEGIRSEEKEENGQKVNVNLVYCLRFTVYRLQSVYSVEGLRDFLGFLAQRAIP